MNIYTTVIFDTECDGICITFEGIYRYSAVEGKGAICNAILFLSLLMVLRGNLTQQTITTQGYPYHVMRFNRPNSYFVSMTSPDCQIFVSRKLLV
jgi:hypothetical protein